MPMIDEIEAGFPLGWHVTHIMFIDTSWQVNVYDDEHAVVATGETIEDALNNATAKILECIYVGRLFNGLRPPRVEVTGSLLERLGLAKKVTINRRV